MLRASNQSYAFFHTLLGNDTFLCPLVFASSCVVSAWAWVSEGMKSAADLHQKLGKAIEVEAVKPTHQVLSVHEKKRKSVSQKFSFLPCLSKISIFGPRSKR